MTLILNNKNKKGKKKRQNVAVSINRRLKVSQRKGEENTLTSHSSSPIGQTHFYQIPKPHHPSLLSLQTNPNNLPAFSPIHLPTMIWFQISLDLIPSVCSSYLNFYFQRYLFIVFFLDFCNLIDFILFFCAFSFTLL